MQYRRCLHSGLALSALRLRLSAHAYRKTPGAVREIVERGLENGINAFQIDSADAGFLNQIAQVLKVVDRGVLFISMTARDNYGVAYENGINVDTLKQRLTEAFRLPGLQRLDLLSFQAAEYRALTAEDHAFLHHLIQGGMIGQVGVQIETADFPNILDIGQPTSLLTNFDVTASKARRHMLETASRMDLSVFGQNYYPARLLQGGQGESIRSHLQNVQDGDAPQGPSKYSFLFNEIGWTAQEICLGFALSQPALVNVGVVARDSDHLDRLAKVVGRTLPRALHAHIELGTFEDKAA